MGISSYLPKEFEDALWPIVFGHLTMKAIVINEEGPELQGWWWVEEYLDGVIRS
jgi:hypothetical protein